MTLDALHDRAVALLAEGRSADETARLLARHGADVLALTRLLQGLYRLPFPRAKAAALFAVHGAKSGRPWRPTFEGTVAASFPDGARRLLGFETWTGRVTAGAPLRLVRGARDLGEHLVEAVDLQPAIGGRRARLTLTFAAGGLDDALGARAIGVTG